jgi:hypothetical protein
VRAPDVENAPLATSDRLSRGEGFASGGSSPSREVQEIFSLNNSEHAAAASIYFEDKTGDDRQARSAIAWTVFIIELTCNQLVGYFTPISINFILGAAHSLLVIFTFRRKI